MGGLSLGLHLLRCPAAVGHPDPPTAEGLCVEQRRGGRLPDLVLLGGVLLCIRHVLCDPGRAVTVARPGSSGRDSRACIHTSSSSAVGDCPELRRAMGDLAQHRKGATGGLSYIHTSSYSAWSHRPPRQQRSGAYKVPTEPDQVWRVTCSGVCGKPTAARAVVARGRAPKKRC